MSLGQFINLDFCKSVAFLVLAVSKTEPLPFVRVVLQMTRYVAVKLLLLWITTFPVEST